MVENVKTRLNNLTAVSAETNNLVTIAPRITHNGEDVPYVFVPANENPLPPDKSLIKPI